MTGGADVGNGQGSAGAGQRGADVIDAEFEIVGEMRQPSAAANPSRDAGASLAGLAMLDRSRSDPGHFAQRGGPVFWAGGIALALMAFWVSGGHAFFPVGQPGAETAGLRISAIDSRVEGGVGRSILHVEGGLTNDGEEAVQVPPIGIDVTAADGAKTRYLLGTNGGMVGPGESFTFSSRLVAPKSGVASVSLNISQ